VTVKIFDDDYVIRKKYLNCLVNVRFSLSHIYQTPLFKYRTYVWYSPFVGLLYIMRRQSFMREHFHVVTNVSRTVIAYVAHIYV